MRVVLEPGHGQGDPGAVGEGGITEAEVVTQLVRTMVLRTDENIRYEPKRRAPKLLGGLLALLNALRRNRPDVVMSIHCDWRGGRAAVYYWEKDPDVARMLASSKLADAVRTRLRDATGGEVLVRTAPYMREGKLFTPGILVRTALRAAVLVEAGPIGPVMATGRWQWSVTDALDRGLRDWRKTCRD